MTFGTLRNGVGRIVAGDRGKQRGGVGDRTGQRAADVSHEVERHYAVSTRETDGWTYADKGVVGRGAADGVAGIRSKAGEGEIGGD
jgi:hypothetical protein